MYRSPLTGALQFQLSLVLFAFAMSFLTPKSHAEWVYHIDSTGRFIQVDTEDPNSPYRIPPQGPTKRLKGTAIAFSVTYADVTDGTNFGFDDPILGGLYQDVVDDVLRYIDCVLDESGAVDIFFDISTNDPNAGLLARAGPFFGAE